MRYLIITLLLVTFYSAQANDTLTRAQVYDFGVGDTFDYRYHSAGQITILPNPTVYSDTTSYNRFIICAIDWSTDSSTIYIVRDELYRIVNTFDTLTLTSAQADEVNFNGLNLNELADTILVDSLQLYFGMPTNYASYYSNFPQGNYFFESDFFAKGLGRVINYYHSVSWGGGNVSTTDDSIILIYYSGANGTYGTPYYTILASIGNVQMPNEAIRVFPTLNNGAITVETSSDIQNPINFSLYDLQGKKVNQFVLSDGKNELQLQGLSSGLYVWKAYTDEQFLKAGKIIIR